MATEELETRLVIRPAPGRRVARIVFLALFAIGAWLLIRLDRSRLAPAAVLFVGVPLVLILDALMAFRVHPKGGRAARTLSPELVRYKDRSYAAISQGLSRYLGPPATHGPVR